MRSFTGELKRNSIIVLFKWQTTVVKYDLEKIKKEVKRDDIENSSGTRF